MQPGAVHTVVLATALLLAGCIGAPGAGTPAPSESQTATTTPPTVTPTATSPTTTPTPMPLDALPSPTRCLTGTVPHPSAVDGVEPSAYPDPPENPTREDVVKWVQAFETAYFRNTMLAGERPDDDMTLTEVSAYAEVRAVNRTTRGYTIRFSDSGATNYASGIHGDHWMDVGYVVNETHLVRVPLEGRESPVRSSAGTIVVDCS